jgi:hypothetical protein
MKYFLFIMIVLFELLGCTKSKKYTYNDQIKIINKFKSSDVEYYTFYNNSDLIQCASSNFSDDFHHGFVINFGLSGEVINYQHILPNNEKIREEGVFINNKLDEFNFWKDSNCLLLTADYNTNSEINAIEGCPYFIMSKKQYFNNDTLTIKIVGANLPFYKNRLSLMEATSKSKLVEYINDYRIMRVHYPVNNKSDSLVFVLEAQILDSSDIIKYTKSDTFTFYNKNF